MDKMLSLMGLAKRAGMLAVGDTAVTNAARTGRAKIITLACDSAGNTIGRFKNRSSCDVVKLPFTKIELGGALGIRACAVAALCDKGFAEKFKKLYESNQNCVGGAL